MICVYESTATDFSNNGLGAVTPQSCTVTETLNGEWELTLVHPIDENGKWLRMTEGRILRAPVPAAMTPQIDIVTPPAEETLIYRVSTSGRKLRLRAGVETGYQVIGTYDNGTQVIVLDTTNPNWYEVSCPDGKHGYMAASNLQYVRTTTSQEAKTEVIEARQLRDQPFRIYRVVPELDKVTVYARHIFYDLLDNMIRCYKPASSDTGATVVQGIASNCLSAHNFTMYSDLTSTAEGVEFVNVNPVEAILGDEGLINSYGGELVRDWFDVFVVNRVGKSTDVYIRERKNLTAVSYDIDETDVITRIMPTGTDKDGEILYLPEVYIDSENIDIYPHPKWYHMDVSEAKEVVKGEDTKTREQCYTEMRNAVQAEFDKGCDLPNVTLKVDFVNAPDAEEFSQYQALMNIFIGDSVHVIARRIGIAVAMRMTQYTYDCLTRKYTSVTLGTVDATLEGSTISAAQLPSGSITGTKLAVNSVGSGQLRALSVDSAQLNLAAVKTAHIEDAAVTRAKIGEAAIGSAQIEDAVIGTAKIADAAITHTKVGTAAIESANIATAAVTEAKIGTAAISTAKIDDAAVTRAKIANLAVDAAKIDDLAVTTAKLANAAITNAKIANAAVDTAQIALGAITAALIQNGAIGTAQIADASITEGKIVSLNADVIQSGTLATERLIITGNDGLIYEINAEASGLSVQELSESKYKQQLNGSVIVARSITADRIAAAAITANEILAGTITGDKIAAATIEGSSIKAGAITTSHLSANFGEMLDLSSNTGINLRVAEINSDIDDVRETAVANTEVLYALSTSFSSAPLTGWSANAPPWEDGKYMWQKTVTTYISGDTDESTPTCLTGATGATGAAGESATTLRIESSRGTVFKRLCSKFSVNATSVMKSEIPRFRNLRP